MVIPEYWNGPPESGNGGYTCGLVAGLLEASSADVSLRAPPPLETALVVEHAEGSVRVLDGETVVAEGRTVPPPAVEPPRRVGWEEAAAASEAGLERWSAAHPFPTCVVCGPDREDGLHVYPGQVEDGLFAAPWRAGATREQVWAALDCPTSAPVANWGEGGPVVLARLHAHVDRVPEEGEELVVVSWALETDGRKRHAAAALLDGEGSVLARARALWIELREG